MAAFFAPLLEPSRVAAETRDLTEELPEDDEEDFTLPVPIAADFAAAAVGRFVEWAFDVVS